MAATFPTEGRCPCGKTHYRLLKKPMFIHCCHCTWCQRETGSAFNLIAIIESEFLEQLGAPPATVTIPTESGGAQKVHQCAQCHVALWSIYGSMHSLISSVRVGTLEHADAFPPDVHIYTSTKQPWMVLPEGVPSFEEYYDKEKLWPAESYERLLAVRARGEAMAAEA